MTAPPDDDQAGYGRSPLQSRRKKRPSGTRPKKSRRQEDDLQIMHRLLLSPVSISLNGEMRRVTAIEAIVSQLQRQEISGSSRASRILLSFRKLARQHGEKKIQIVFVENETTGPVSGNSADV